MEKEYSWIDYLTKEDISFIKNLILSSGSLKKLQKEYGVSYPTIRHKLDGIIDKIDSHSQDQNTFNQKLMQLVIDEDISFSTADKIMNIYTETNND
ncbi:DUF2089 family protein [Weissella viridescens]|uniref:DUF2089 family protein n=1 Tax=Weissella viridescens TaxID=1629 RepID=UPI003AF23017